MEQPNRLHGYTIIKGNISFHPRGVYDCPVKGQLEHFTEGQLGGELYDGKSWEENTGQLLPMYVSGLLDVTESSVDLYLLKQSPDPKRRSIMERLTLIGGSRPTGSEDSLCGALFTGNWQRYDGLLPIGMEEAAPGNVLRIPKQNLDILLKQNAPKLDGSSRKKVWYRFDDFGV